MGDAKSWTVGRCPAERRLGEKGLLMSRMFEAGPFEKLTLVSPLATAYELQEGDDPVHDLLNEFQDYEFSETIDPLSLIAAPPKVSLEQREEQMWLTLDQQLGSLREGLQRLHYYLSDVDDSVRR